MLLFFFILNSLISCLLGALLMKRFGFTVIREKRIVQTYLIPHPDHFLAQLSALGEHRHRFEDHEGRFDRCADFQCAGLRRLLAYLLAARQRYAPPHDCDPLPTIEQPVKKEFDFDNSPPPPLFGAAPEKGETHAST